MTTINQTESIFVLFYIHLQSKSLLFKISEMEVKPFPHFLSSILSITTFQQHLDKHNYSKTLHTWQNKCFMLKIARSNVDERDHKANSTTQGDRSGSIVVNHRNNALGLP